MRVYPSSRIRNVVLLGHAGSGKTTLSETMLFESGSKSRRGSVEQQSTSSDYHEIEHEKGKSVFGTLLNLDWRGNKINLIDTPGTSDYIGEVVGALRVADTAIFSLNAEYGVETGAELHWKYTERYNIPSLLIVNKPDSSQSEFQKTVDGAKERFGRGVVVVQYPYSEGEDFHAIIDVLKMTMYEFPEDGGKPDKLPIPDSHQAQAELLHNELVESVAENDETLLDVYFEQGMLTESQMREGLQQALLNRDIFPLFCCSAKRNMGTGRVMGFLGNVAPNPLEANPPKTPGGEDIPLNPEADPLMFIFKNSSESHMGDMLYFKMYGGTAQPGLDLVNGTTGNTVRLSSLYLMNGEKRREVDQVNTGDIGAAVKLKNTNVNDLLHSKDTVVDIEPIHFPEPVIRTAVELKREGEEDKLGTALHQLRREDPSLQVEHSRELKQVIIHGQGEEHLAVIKYTLEHRFQLDFEFVEPRIPYRETITKEVRTHYKHKKQSGGAGQFAKISMLMEPLRDHMPEHSELKVRDVREIDLDWGGKLVFRNCIVGGVIDNRFMPAILKGIMEKMENGPLSDCRVRDIRISVYDGAMHSVDSNDAAFRTAALMAFREGFMKAAPRLLEPIYAIEVTVPADYMGDVMSDISTRRGQIMGMDAEGAIQKIEAEVPLGELGHYATRLKSLTQGSAGLKRTFSHYAGVPREIQQEIVKQTRERQEVE
ncbi:translation elongation factor 2 (EF-2/EF-G) [Fodinibius roseus]|uniref:Elongation factor G n=1 Tax=Fodinibius roseus TaxID=1194090 RepID=A0A1M5CT66_9BACT|nr:elongation factor G [Fodinibius roseus]SHF57905.1 translation elongation factor 2 (EF-2/EF-G) [Fodinibius roseus]